MANAIFDLGRKAFLDADIDWLVDDIKAVLVDHGVFTPLPGTHQFLSEISTGVVATSPNFTSKTSTAGVADAADLTFTAASGANCESLVIYEDTGVAATSRLIAYIDVATGLPVLPNGGNITVTFDNTANKIFKL